MIAAVGVASQALSALMSALAPSSGSSTSQSTTASGFQQAMPGAGCAASPPPPQTLSCDMLSALMQLQTQSSGAASPDTSAPNSVQQLFSAMDSDGDGEVSKSEMECYIQKSGGTQAQADSLFSSLSQTSSATASTTSGISESQMQSAVSTAQQAHGAHGHHHHHGSKGGSSDSVASTLLQAMDGNDDGSVDQTEFTNFVTANGGSPSDTTNDFAALNTSGSNALTSADFSKAWSAYQTQQNSQSAGSMAVSFLNAFAQQSSSTSVTA